MLETALVFDLEGKTIYWHEPPGRTAGSLPNVRSLWDVLWDNRHNLGGVAHTHPWDGPASPSHTDLTTFDAIERGLGKKLLWPIVTFTDILYVGRLGLVGDEDPNFTMIQPKYIRFEVEGIEELRDRSGRGNFAPEENVTVDVTENQSEGE